MAGRKRDPIWMDFIETKSLSGKGTGTRAVCKKCGQEIQGIVQRLKKHVDSKCKGIPTIELEEESEQESQNTDNIAAGPGSTSAPVVSCTSDKQKETPNFTNTTDPDNPSSSSDMPRMVTCRKCNSNSSCSQHTTVPALGKKNSHLQQIMNNTEPAAKKKCISSNTSMNTTIGSFVVKTSKTLKHDIDLQIAKSIFATNSSFRCIEHPHVKKAINMLRPGYTPPSKIEIAGKLLDEVYKEEKKKCFDTLENKYLCMSLDGWSNVHHEPIVCITVTDEDGKVFLYDSIDTSGHPHTATYLTDISKKAITNCEIQYKCSVTSFVTDNAANMAKMRKDLLEEDLNVITYGCSAHYLNLLSKDFESVSAIKNVREQIVHVVKYFRNSHFASSKYKLEGGNKLVLPQDVRWNTLTDCVEGYVLNWSKLLKICEENKGEIDKIVYEKVINVGLKKTAEDFLQVLKPVAVALDRVQRNSCTISEAVEVWKELERNFHLIPLDGLKMALFKKRYQEALSPCHFLAYMIDPRLNVFTLTTEEKAVALEYAENMYSDTGFLPLLIQFQSKGSPFLKTMFSEEILKNVSGLQWWKAQSSNFKANEGNILNIISQLLTARASSAGVERVFSSYGLVHSKLRNQLGTEKAGKLVFLFKHFNDY